MNPADFAHWGKVEKIGDKYIIHGACGQNVEIKNPVRLGDPTNKNPKPKCEECRIAMFFERIPDPIPS